MAGHLVISATRRVAVLHLVGDHDLVSEAEVMRLLDRLGTQTRVLVLDLTYATFLSPSSLARCVRHWRQKAPGDRIILAVGAHGVVARALWFVPDITNPSMPELALPSGLRDELATLGPPALP